MIELPNSVLYQLGGTGVVLSQSTVPRVIDTGADTSRLGRCAWTRFQGKDKAITLISAYRPCKSSKVGVKIVYEQ